MNIDFFQTYSSLFSHRRDPRCARVLADKLWAMLLITAFAVTVGVVGWAVWLMFFAVPDQSPATAQTSAANQILNRKDLQAVLDAFAARQTRSDDLKNHPPVVVDPAAVPVAPKVKGK